METKRCAVCGQTKSVSEFYKHHTKGYQNTCIPCRKEYNKEHYKKDKDKYIARAKERNLIQKKKAHGFILSYLEENHCVVCGETDPVVLDFDHVNPKNKGFTISQGVRRGKNIEVLKKEIERCQVLCANCHRRKTAKENNWYSCLDQ